MPARTFFASMAPRAPPPCRSRATRCHSASRYALAPGILGGAALARGVNRAAAVSDGWGGAVAVREGEERGY